MPRKNRVTQRRALRGKTSGAASRPSRRWLVGALILALALSTGGGALWARPALRHAVDQTYRLSHIQIEGRAHTKPETLTAAAGLSAGMPLRTLNVSAIQTALRRVPWVEDASVERRFPDRVLIRLRERVPLARWRIGGKTVVVDTAGRAIDGVLSDTFSYLPLIANVGAPHHFATFQNLLRAWPALAEHVTEYEFVSQRRWNIVLRDTLTVMLPERGVEDALARASEIVVRESLLERGVTRLDMRLTDRFALQVLASATENRAKPAED